MNPDDMEYEADQESGCPDSGRQRERGSMNPDEEEEVLNSILFAVPRFQGGALLKRFLKLFKSEPVLISIFDCTDNSRAVLTHRNSSPRWNTRGNYY